MLVFIIDAALLYTSRVVVFIRKYFVYKKKCMDKKNIYKFIRRKTITTGQSHHRHDYSLTIIYCLSTDFILKENDTFGYDESFEIR